jgi:hypothetical protein
MMRQGQCSDPYAGPPPINIRWTTVAAKCNDGSLPDELMRTSYRDFAPRLGFAYSPDPKTVIRAGWGVFYNQEIGNAYFDLARNIAGRVTITSNAGTPSLFYSNSIPGGSGTVANVPSPFAYAMAPDHHTSYAMQYLVNLQRQLTPNLALELGYLGGASRHLQGFQDVNQSIPGTVGSAVSRAPYPGFNNIQYVQDGSTGNYNSLSVKVTRRFNSGLSIISSYTWAKSIDTTSGIRNQGFDTLYPQNSYCISCERGLSAFDTRHRMVTSVLYELPVGNGKALNITNRVANTVIGGWQTGGIFTLRWASAASITPAPPPAGTIVPMPPALVLISTTPHLRATSIPMPSSKLLPDNSAMSGATPLSARGSSASTPKYTRRFRCPTKKITASSSGSRPSTLSTTRIGACLR